MGGDCEIKNSIIGNMNIRIMDLHKSIKMNEQYRTLSIIYFIIYCCAMLMISSVESFNLDSKFPVVVSIPYKNYYFGYSVDMYTDNEDTWLLVGAPNAKNGKGDVYLYKYFNNETESVKFTIERAKSATETIPERLGWTVATAKNKQCLVCGPLFTVAPKQNNFQSNIQYYDPIGICYLITDFMNADREVYKVSPCSMSRGTYHDGDDHGHCSAGFSAAFTKNGDELLLGTPGSYYKQGSIMLIDLPITSDVNSLPIHIGESSPKPPENWSQEDWLRATYDDNYLGYSVATGQSPGNSPILVAGVPRRFGLDLLGMVVVYDDKMNSQLYNFTGNQTGEYFGHSVAVVDVNNDNLDDIIVGAPLYTSFDKKLFENGRVFVYHQLPQADSVSDNQEPMLQFGEPLILEGTQNRAQFGHTVTCLGDINLDGYNDVGIGAPFASNSDIAADGTLFIFNGGKTGLRETFSQEIHGMSIEPNMKSFGYSVSGEKDADHNEYPDVLTGAYLADKVVLLRSRPVVAIEARVSAMPAEIDLENRNCLDSNGPANVGCIVITSCFKYSGKGLPAFIDIQYTYDIDSTKIGDEKRAFLIDEIPKNMKLRSTPGGSGDSEESCVKETAYLQVDIKDKLNTMVIKLSYELIEKNVPIEPVLNMLEEPHAYAHVDMAKDCGPDNICQPQLKLSTTLDPEVVYVGAESPFLVTGVVKNDGDPSYETTFVLEYPSNVYYVGVAPNEPGKIAPTCSFTESEVLCQVGNPLKRGSSTKIKLKFSISGLSGNVSALPFHAFVNSTNSVDSLSNPVEFDMRVEVKSEVIIYNASDPEIILLNKMKSVNGITINETLVQHIYQIRNNGPSTIQLAEINLQWPYQNKAGDFLLEFDELKMDGLKCSPVPSEGNSRRKRDNTDSAGELNVPSYKYYHCDKLAKCFTISCTLEDFKYRDEIAIYIISTLLIPTVNDQADAEIKSELSFKVIEYPYEIDPGPGPTTSSFVKTLTTYDREPISQGIPWWIIAVAIAAGVLVLFIVIVCLWKCGFFKRKKKHMTEQQQHEQKELLQNQKINEDEEALDSYLK